MWCKLFVMGVVLSCLSLHGASSMAQAPPEPETPTRDDTKEVAQANEAELAALRQVLIVEHGYSEAWFSQPEAQRALSLATLKAREALDELAGEPSRDEQLMLRGAARIISSQLQAKRLKRRERRALAIQLADNLANQSFSLAKSISVRISHNARHNHVIALQAFLSTQHDHHAQLADVREKQAEEDELKRLQEERTRLEAMNLKRRAEADLKKIKDRQRQATTQQLKELLGTQAELAQRVIQLTDEHPALKKNFARINDIDQQSFAQTKDELDLFIEQLPEQGVELKASKQTTVDTLFEALRTQQRKARRDFLATRKLEKEFEIEHRISVARTKGEEDKLEQATQDYEESESEINEARLELATTRAKLGRLEADMLNMRLEDALTRHRRLDEELSYFHATKERLIDVLSSKKRASFYSLTNDQNWKDARLGAQIALVRFTEHAALRIDMFIDVISNPFSINLWSWVGSLIIRLLCVFGIAYLVTQRGGPVIKRIMSALLKRPFFRKYPTITLKSGEVLRHLLRPTAIFLGWFYMLNFGQLVLPELRFVQWFINAIFIFRVLTIIISVVVLPRTVREPHKVVEEKSTWQSTPTDKNRVTGEEESVDLFALSISRARKLVRSARVITLFWLLVIYVPALTIEFIGHTVIWRLIDIATTWGFILVIYSVLSTWRDEIARLFEKLAIERLPRSVHFVNQNKDRVWGVLVIAGASVYVIGSESLRLGKRYLIETQWSKQINNFIFRKQIEYKQRDRDKQEDDQDLAFNFKNLPEQYRDFFEDRPLTDEVYHVESNANIHEKIMAHYTSWRSIPNQGSVAMHGEAGMGRSTLLFELGESMNNACQEHHTQIVYTRLIERCVTENEILNFTAKLFSIEAPSSRAELVEAINALPTHVLLIDDCQRLFLRQIGGFTGLETFLQVVNLTDGHHFWVLTFERFAWSYLARIKQRAHYFGHVLELAPWTEQEVQDLIWKRNLMTGLTANFTDLVVTRDNGDEDVSFEVIKSAKGYFRLLHDFSKGNPRVAMLYWLRSIKPNEEDETVIDVGLFRSPPQRALLMLQDNYWFTLTAIAQHGALNSKEIASIINADEGFCEMALNYFQEKQIVTLDNSRRAKLTAVYMRQILKQLTVSNYLYD